MEEIGLSKYSSLPMATLVMQYTSVLKAALAFGFAAALLEGFPVIRLMFTVSNRIGAAI